MTDRDRENLRFYRKEADRLRLLAEDMDDIELRRQHLSTALQYDALADSVERIVLRKRR